MATLSGIWAAAQPVSISVGLIGGIVTVTIAADCVATCTTPLQTLLLTGGLPAMYTPSDYRASNMIVSLNGTTVPGTAVASPTGWLGFAVTGGQWAADSGSTTSGVKACTFTYAI